jgi:hypothetical protein
MLAVQDFGVDVTAAVFALKPLNQIFVQLKG